MRIEIYDNSDENYRELTVHASSVTEEHVVLFITCFTSKFFSVVNHKTDYLEVRHFLTPIK